MIGDGMGPAQVEVAAKYRSIASPDDPSLVMNTFPVQGTTSTHPVPESTITDSAAAGTALACGVKTKNEMIGMTPSGERLKSMAFTAKERGKRVAIVTSVGINHATPASFYSQRERRSMYDEIGSDLAASGFDFFAGEPLLGSEPEQNRKLIRLAGYEIVSDADEIRRYDGKGKKVLTEHPLTYRPDAEPGDLCLADLVRTGVRAVEDCEKGFFMMVEGGKIDKSGHANDIGSNIGETLAFDEAVSVAYEFYKKHPEETLIVVTADHETGGMSCSFDGAFNPERFVSTVRNQKASAVTLKPMLKQWQQEGLSASEVAKNCAEACGLSDLSAEELAELESIAATVLSGKKRDKGSQELRKMYGSKNPLITACFYMVAERCGVTWSSFTHTPVRVPTMAIGPGSARFGGETDNTDLGKELTKLLQ